MAARVLQNISHLFPYAMLLTLLGDECNAQFLYISLLPTPSENNQCMKRVSYLFCDMNLFESCVSETYHLTQGSKYVDASPIPNMTLPKYFVYVGLLPETGIRLWHVLSQGYGQSISLLTLLLQYQSPTASDIVWNGINAY